MEFLLLEGSGKIYVLKKMKDQNLTKRVLYLNLFNQDINLPIELIMDGIAVDKNCHGHYSSVWLDEQLKSRNLQRKDIQYARHFFKRIIVYRFI